MRKICTCAVMLAVIMSSVMFGMLGVTAAGDTADETTDLPGYGEIFERAYELMFGDSLDEMFTKLRGEDILIVKTAIVSVLFVLVAAAILIVIFALCKRADPSLDELEDEDEVEMPRVRYSETDEADCDEDDEDEDDEDEEYSGAGAYAQSMTVQAEVDSPDTDIPTPDTALRHKGNMILFKVSCGVEIFCIVYNLFISICALLSNTLYVLALIPYTFLMMPMLGIIAVIVNIRSYAVSDAKYSEKASLLVWFVPLLMVVVYFVNNIVSGTMMNSWMK